MLLDTGILTPEDHAEKLFTAPFIKAAGVGIRITATTETPPIKLELHITPFLGRGMAITKLPELEPEIPVNTLGLFSVSHSSIMETRLSPIPEFDTVIPAVVYGHFFIASHGTVMDTALPELSE